jgi:acylphosphatase
LQVEGEAQGDEEHLNKLLAAVATGPRHAKVEKLEKNEIETKEGETKFMVVR